MSRRFLILDGSNLIRRTWAAQPGEDSPQKLADTLRTTAMSVRRALNEHSPTHAVAVFDSGSPNFRHALFPGYKAGRTPEPPLLRAGQGKIEDLLFDEFSINSIIARGVEADDVIATLALKWVARAAPGSAIVLSTDKDLTQLVAHGISVRDHFGRQWRDADWIREKWGIEPFQVLDYISLVGDASDSIPGVKGVGPKTAAELLREHGTLDAILADAVDGTATVHNRLRTHHDLALLSRELATLKHDAACGVTWGMLELHTPRGAPSHTSAVTAPEAAMTMS